MGPIWTSAMDLWRVQYQLDKVAANAAAPTALELQQARDNAMEEYLTVLLI